VLDARSNFEGGPSALAAALTGRTPRYGYHLDASRRATRRFRLTAAPRDLSEWGALGGIVGEACGSYWQVPVVEGLAAAPGSSLFLAPSSGVGSLEPSFCSQIGPTRST
jgi:predicted aconitase